MLSHSRLPSWASELRRRSLRVYPFNAGLQLVQSSAGSAATALAGIYRLLTGTGANKIREHGEAYISTGLDPYFGLDGKSSWGRPWYVSVLMALDSATVPTATTFAGLEIGSHNAVPPFLAAPNAPVIQLRARLDTLAFELLVGKGDGVTAAVVTALAGVPALPNSSEFVHLELEYNPGEYVRAYVNGILGATHSATATLPIQGVTAGFGAALFVTSGTDVGGAAGADFSTMIAETMGFA